MRIISRDFRHPSLGVVLLSTLVSVLLLLALVAVLQARVLNNLKVVARLKQESQMAPVRDAIHERLRGLLASAMVAEAGEGGDLPLNGIATLEEGGLKWQVSVQDVEGLVDIYRASPAVLGLLPAYSSRLQVERDLALAAFPPGTSFPTVESSLANFGLDATERERLVGSVTQSGSSTGIRRETIAPPLANAAESLSVDQLYPGQTRHVVVDIQPLQM